MYENYHLENKMDGDTEDPRLRENQANQNTDKKFKKVCPNEKLIDT